MNVKQERRWTEISVEADPHSVDDLVTLLGRYCAGGAVVEDRPGDPARDSALRRVIVKGFLPTWEEETLRKLEIVLLLLGKASPISEPRIRVLEPEDWAESWKAFFPPQHIGQCTVIVPTWHEYTPQPGEVIIRLDPGMAFGTGLHATTRLCLRAVERLLQPGMSVLDVGTGSGILAIAAALQGAEHVEAVDIDAVSVEVARQNAELNHVCGQVTVSAGTLGGPSLHHGPLHTTTGYDLLLANILAEVIATMAPGIAQALRVGGLFATSGILCEKAEMVTQALERAGLVVDERDEEEGWAALIGHKA
jgi:ribosomal protein L11 methyltransferase